MTVICLYCRQSWKNFRTAELKVRLILHYAHACPGVEYRNKKGVIK